MKTSETERKEKAKKYPFAGFRPTGKVVSILEAVMSANGAPQECASAAIGLALAGIPYFIARAREKMG